MTPYSLVEVCNSVCKLLYATNHLQFQAGAFDPWGGPGFAACASLVNHEFSRVFYKNNFSFRVAIFNLYMVRYGIHPLHFCTLTLSADIRWNQLG